MDQKDLKEIEELFDKAFDKNFDKSFDKSFDKAFDKNFDRAFDKAFDKSFDKAFNKAFIDIWENNFQPAFDQISEDYAIVKTKLDKALYREFQRVDELEKDMKLVKEKLGIS